MKQTYMGNFSGADKAITLVKAVDVRYSYPNGSVALDGVSLEVNKSSAIALMGANGTGKSSFLLCVAGVLKFQGVIELFGEILNEQTVRAMRKKIGVVFQNPDDQLFSPTVLDDLMFAPLNYSIPQNTAKEMAIEAVKKVGMFNFLDKAPIKLSYGEKKKIAIAIALVLEPELLLLDEPLNGIDPKSSAQIIDILLSLKENGKTIIATTHQPYFAEEIADRLIILNEKKRVEISAPPADILSKKELLIAMNLLHEHKHSHDSVAHSHHHLHRLEHEH